MTRRRIHPTLLASAALALAAPNAQAFDSSRYVGHLQLDATTLVITEAVPNLEVPWDIEFSLDGWLWYTEHRGLVHRYHPDTGATETLLEVTDLYYKKSLGLLGMALSPNFDAQPHVYLHYTYREQAPDRTEIIRSRLVRYAFVDGKLAEPTTLLDAIPGASYHNGSRIVASADGYLFLSTGDAGAPEGGQDPSLLQGKILRLRADGSIPADNPFPKSPVWSLGHRNIQGLALVPDGQLYASDHGPNNDDELNLILPARNYGWPNIEGFIDTPHELAFAAKTPTVEPLRAWTPTIATAGLAYYDHPAVPEWSRSLLLATLKGRSLRVLSLAPDGKSIERERLYFQKRFGRLRDVCVSPTGDIYLATSNLDWHPRYQPWMYDALPEGRDRILRLSPAGPDDLAQLASLPQPIEIREDDEAIALLSENWNHAVTAGEIGEGEALYLTHCAACHNPVGTGAPGLFPPLVATDWVTGDKSRLIQVTLAGMRGPITVNGLTYDQEMPSFASRTDDEIAKILTYIRQAWGNQASAVIPGEVFEERKALPKP